jgi:hypothetical protein
VEKRVRVMAIRGHGVVIVAALLLVAGSATGRPLREPFRCEDLVNHEGQIVEIGDTTITIHEWAGKYTYKLAATERWKLEASQIRQGDQVRFLACDSGEVAKEFKKIERE